MEKHKVAIVIDSTAFIPQETLEQYPIHVIPLNLHWGKESQLDGVDITVDEFYERLQQEASLPTTSQPSAGRFLEFFNKVAEEAESIVGIFISSDLSGTYASAHAAVDMLGDFPIEIVDCRSTSLVQGILALIAARAAESGKDYKEVADTVRRLVPHTRLMFVVDTLEYLHKGGRIGGARHLLGSVLSIKPLLSVVDGRIEPLASVRTKKKAVKRLLEIAREDTAGMQKLHVGVIHASAPEEGEALCRQVAEQLAPQELMLSQLSPVVGAHVGPGAVGFGYLDAALVED